MFVVSLTAVSGSGCTARDRSNIIFILDNEEVLKINSIDKIDCGTPEISVRLTEEEMKILSENTVKKVRMNFTDSQYDFVVSENEKPKFIEQLNCILNIK